MFIENVPALVEDLRYALGVMQEHSHLGLDPERIALLKALMERKISEGERVLNSPVGFRLTQAEQDSRDNWVVESVTK